MLLFIAIQYNIGILTLNRFRHLESCNQVRLPLALLLGGALVTISATSLSTLGLSDYFHHLIATLICVLFLNRGTLFGHRSASPYNKFTLSHSICISPIASLLIVHDQQRALTTFFAALVATKFIERESDGSNGYIRSRTLGIVSILFVMIDFLSSSLPREVSVYSSIIRGSDDIVFSESISQSILANGISNNLAATGTGIRYHWLSLAWTGFTSEFAHLPPLAGSSLVAPFVGLTLGYFALSQIPKSRNKLVPIAQWLTLGVLVSNFGFDRVPIFFVMNTSNIFAVALLLIFILVLTQAESNTLSFFVLMLVLVVLTILTKVTAGLLTVVLLTIWLVAGTRQVNKIEQSIKLVLTATTALFAYLLFIRPFSWSQIGYSLVIPNLDVQSLSSLVKESMFIPLVMLLVFRSWHFEIDRRVRMILLAAGLFSIPRFFLDGRSGEIYFYVSSLTVVFAFAVRVLTDEGRGVNLKTILPMTVGIAPFVFFFPRHISETLLFAVLLVIFLLTFRKGVGRSRIAKYGVAVALVWSILNGVSGIPSGMTRLSRDDVFTFEEVALLHSFGNELTRSDIIATNRFLCASQTCSFDDSSFLISAVTGRDVFIEGPRFVSGGSPYPRWITDRVRFSIEASKGLPSAIQLLKEKGVTVYWLDKRFGTNLSCDSLGTILVERKDFCAVRF